MAYLCLSAIGTEVALKRLSAVLACVGLLVFGQFFLPSDLFLMKKPVIDEGFMGHQPLKKGRRGLLVYQRQQGEVGQNLPVSVFGKFFARGHAVQYAYEVYSG